MSERPVIAPEDCPEPFWHETHRYCPCCSWQEPQPEPEPSDLDRACDLLVLLTERLKHTPVVSLRHRSRSNELAETREFLAEVPVPEPSEGAISQHSRGLDGSRGPNVEESQLPAVPVPDPQEGDVR